MNTRKTILISLLLIACMSPLAHAQDTLISTMLPSNYYVPDWPDTNGRVKIHCVYTRIDDSKHKMYACKKLPAKDPLTIYGVATAYFKYDFVYPHEGKYVADTVPEHTIEYVALMERVGIDSFSFVTDTIPVRMDNSQIRYYYKHPYEYRYAEDDPESAYFDLEDYHAIREAYFDEGITVADNFYIAASIFSMSIETGWDEATNSNQPFYEHCPFHILLTTDLYLQTMIEDSMFYINPSGHCFYQNQAGGMYYIFPILTPQPDTPDDSLAVEEANLLQSYVAVTPNPACERVKVTSSFGMEKVEIFNTQGTLILVQPASGLQAELDVQSLPTGIYFVKVHTPMGIATKRLIVSR